MMSHLIPASRIDRENGFTLIEILVVMAIVSALVGIAIPFYLAAMQRAYVTSLTSDIVQTATRYSLNYQDSCGIDQTTCVLPSQATFTSSIKVASNSNNVITAYVYQPAALTSAPNAEQYDANDYYGNGIVCIQGANTKQLTANSATDPIPTGNTTWSYYLVLGQGSGLTALQDPSDDVPSSGSNNIHQGPCSGTTVGALSNYLNTNTALINARATGWSVTTVYN